MSTIVKFPRRAFRVMNRQFGRAADVVEIQHRSVGEVAANAIDAQVERASAMMDRADREIAVMARNLDTVLGFCVDSVRALEVMGDIKARDRIEHMIRVSAENAIAKLK